ncbi:MAG TPA: acetyl-CoA C-acetyltransferase [Gammaproteobacteria bacterium]|nr:acetyl-CoA C-acetyltransferase [Gammaproteobacteria bacterium]
MKNKLKDVYVVDGLRTPFIKAMGRPNPLSAADLAVAAASPLLARQPFKPSEIDEVIAGCVAPSADEMNIARIIALRSGCGIEVPAFTVQRNCASGLQALENAALNIRSGKSELVLAGGTECMSRAPLLYPNEMTNFLAHLRSRKGLIDQLKAVLQFRPYFLKPILSLLKGLNDPIVNLSMGQTAENLVYEFGITREAMDAFAVQSHDRASAAQKDGLFEEITPLFDWQGGMIESDNGVREGSTVEKLATLKPVFDKPFGSVTAGNSSQVTDGAAFLILASESSVKKYELPVLGKIVDTAWAALDPAVMGLGPAHAIQKLLTEQDLSLSDIDYWEMNEAFAAQMLACLKSLGSIPLEKLNVDGGAIAIGHPVGATGARLVLHLLHVLKRNNAKRGVASLCIGGGQGGAMLLEAF